MALQSGLACLLTLVWPEKKLWSLWIAMKAKKLHKDKKTVSVFMEKNQNILFQKSKN